MIQNDILNQNIIQLFLEQNITHCHGESRLYRVSSKIDVVLFSEYCSKSQFSLRGPSFPWFLENGSAKSFETCRADRPR